jgi:hypothetical protein
MSLGSRVLDVQHKVFDRTRHPDARRVVAEPGTEPDFSALEGEKHALVGTFKRDGTVVPTPVWFTLDGPRRMLFRSEEHTHKLRRIARDPRVRVCPCNVRGKPLGPVAEGRARVLSGAEEEAARRALVASWSADQKLFEGGTERIGARHVYLEVTPA